MVEVVYLIAVLIHIIIVILIVSSLYGMRVHLKSIAEDLRRIAQNLDNLQQQSTSPKADAEKTADAEPNSPPINADTSQRNASASPLWEPNSPPINADSMVLVPEGDFEMGSNASETSEKPVHTVSVDAFYIDAYAVTVGHYKQFVQETGHPAPNWDVVSKYSPTDQHPILFVSWHDAMAYATWVGKRLPTEAEWEKAARGGLSGATYPWGDDAPDGTQCNLTGNKDGYEHTAPVGSFPPNGYGLYDMTGNVSEWCLDEWDAGFYANSPRRNPIAGETIANVLSNFANFEKPRVLRGGSWSDTVQFMRVATRNWGRSRDTLAVIGFRCVKDGSFSVGQDPRF